ncbi:MAG: serine hydrolase [Legionella sp.]|nr:serine hydrolase [Legionella sp.]
MKPKFSIAIHYAQDQEILLSLERDGRTGQEIRLGGKGYFLSYLGDDIAKARIVETLEETFVDNDRPVTQEALKKSLESFGIVAVTSRSEKLQRGLKRAAIMGKGMQQMSRRQTSDEARGRTMVENPHINLFMEVRTEEEEELLAKQREGVFRCWKTDKNANLALPEWEAYKKEQWKKNQTELDFVPWLYHQIWEQSGTKDDILTWLIRFEYEKFNVEMPFDEWKKAFISDITTYYGQYCDAHATQAEILNAWLEKSISGLNLSDADYVTFKAWRKAGKIDHFQAAILRKAWEQTDKRLSLEKYTELKRQALDERWEKSGLKQAGVSFQYWREMQDPTLVNDTGLRPFIRCDAKTRKLYHVTSSQTGEILRNGRLYSTEYDTTLHSGKGYAIFVVDSDEQIYAGSHIQQVFHHSSFLSNAATLASGEVRMGLESFIQYAKDKHHADVMLAEFTSNNKDPYKIQFIKNEKDNTWTIAGEDAEANMQIIPVPAGSELETSLQDPAMKDLSFSKRSTILTQAATVLGRKNPTDQVTLLSSKSGHYQPKDEENYYMLKLWERHGVDLSQTPFVSLGSSEAYRCAQEYLDLIEPRMRARQETRLYLETGSVQNHLREPLSSVQNSVVINEKSECYEGGLSHPAFSHPNVLHAKNLPGYREGALVLKEDVKLRIEKLKAKLVKATVDVKALDKLIKNTSKRMRARRLGRRLLKENTEARIEKMTREINVLENALSATYEPPGTQIIRGGGVMTLNAAGEVIEVDAKLGNYVLSPQEIEKTLLTLKQRGVNLESLSLITYDGKGRSIPLQNAHQYIIDKSRQVLHEGPSASLDVGDTSYGAIARKLGAAPSSAAIAESFESAEEKVKQEESILHHQKKELKKLIEHHKVVGASVAVLDNGEMSAFSAGKLVSGGEQNLTPDGVFEAASLSKPVFAYIVLKIVERGDIDLDAPLCQLSQNGFGPPELRETPEYQQLTARMVLSHQTGLPNWWPHSFQAEPGAQFNYSGLAFTCLCDVIQESSGLSLEQLAKRELEPLGIVQSHYFYQPEDDADEKRRFAVGHNAAGVPDEKSHYVKQSEENPQMLFEKPLPAASLFITAEHYAKFLDACINDKFIREHMFVDSNDLAGRDKKGLEAGVPSDMLNQLHWGLGMGIQNNKDGSKTLFHWGDSETFRNLATLRIEEDGSYKGVVCLTNSADGAAIFRQVSEPIVGDNGPISVWLRKREKLNVSKASFSTTVESPDTQYMREQLQAIKSEEKNLDSSSSAETSNTPGIRGSK